MEVDVTPKRKFRGYKTNICVVVIDTFIRVLFNVTRQK